MKNIQQVINKITGMSEEEFWRILPILENSGFIKKEIDIIKKEYAVRGNNVKAQTRNKETIIGSIYKEEIRKFTFLAKNKTLQKRLGGIKLILFGETGTGKTTIANELSNNVKNTHKILNIRVEDLVSHKMGQTQINILKLLDDINIMAANNDIFLFFDEIDSIVMNRNSSNDVGEHARIVATFIKFMDGLKENVIFTAATNILQNIDIAIMRRFNFKIEGKFFDINKMEIILRDSGIEVSKRKFSKFKNKDLIKEFKISEAREFIDNCFIEKSFNNGIDTFVYFAFFFKNKKSVDISSLSERDLSIAKKTGLLNG